MEFYPILVHLKLGIKIKKSILSVVS